MLFSAPQDRRTRASTSVSRGHNLRPQPGAHAAPPPSPPPRRTVCYTALWLLLYAGHVYYLTFVEFNYGYNMAASVGAGEAVWLQDS